METVYLLNAFAKVEGGGNPAGVVLEADDLTDHEMLNIAREVGFSETAFVSSSELADFRVRFFTPAAEVDLCGHATIATFSLLFRMGIIRVEEYSQETKAGILKISVKEDGTIFMQQNCPIFGEIIPLTDIADSLNITGDDLVDNLPVQTVSTGLPDIIVPIQSLEILNAIQPDFAKVKELSQIYSVVGFHLFCLETLNDNSAHCRNLAPLFDIEEEAATGTASGALASYLYKQGLINEDQAGNLVFEQGYSMNRPSEIKVKLEIENEKIKKVWVGGKAEFVGKRKIES